jgi:bacterioferritin (cytochrome b1)
MMPSKEGEFSVPDGEVIAQLQKLLSCKNAIDLAYRNFSDRIRGPWRDSLAQHWYEHAEDERKSAYSLAMKVIGIGADPVQSYVQIPVCTPSIEAFIQVLLSMELDIIQAGRDLAKLAGDNMGLRIFAEDLVLVDTHHADDLRRWGIKVGSV